MFARVLISAMFTDVDNRPTEIVVPDESNRKCSCGRCNAFFGFCYKVKTISMPDDLETMIQLFVKCFEYESNILDSISNAKLATGSYVPSLTMAINGIILAINIFLATKYDHDHWRELFEDADSSSGMLIPYESTFISVLLNQVPEITALIAFLFIAAENVYSDSLDESCSSPLLETLATLSVAIVERGGLNRLENILNDFRQSGQINQAFYDTVINLLSLVEPLQSNVAIRVPDSHGSRSCNNCLACGYKLKTIRMPTELDGDNGLVQTLVRSEGYRRKMMDTFLNLSKLGIYLPAISATINGIFLVIENVRYGRYTEEHWDEIFRTSSTSVPPIPYGNTTEAAGILLAAQIFNFLTLFFITCVNSYANDVDKTRLTPLMISIKEIKDEIAKRSPDYQLISTLLEDHRERYGDKLIDDLKRLVRNIQHLQNLRRGDHVAEASQLIQQPQPGQVVVTINQVNPNATPVAPFFTPVPNPSPQLPTGQGHTTMTILEDNAETSEASHASPSSSSSSLSSTEFHDASDSIVSTPLGSFGRVPSNSQLSIGLFGRSEASTQSAPELTSLLTTSPQEP